ncbi:MAG TPA: 6-bladed beta-propeller [Candidatus Acidoferrum sp.]
MRAAAWAAGVLALLAVCPRGAAAKEKAAPVTTAPELLLDGGRKLTFERSISDERDVRTKRGFWKKVLDVVAGEPDFHKLVRPYSVVTDSRGRILVSDPDARGVHIFDFAEQKYKFVARKEGRDPMRAPQCLAVDAKDDLYVTDSESGRIFVFDAKGKYQRMIGALKFGEGLFKRPTGIAIDSARDRIYVTDTMRNKIYVLDMAGSVVKTIGKPGKGEGEFNYPTELRLEGDRLLVVDAMNFRVQVLNRDGEFQYAIGRLGDGRGNMFRPKGIGLDSEGHLYVVDGFGAMVQVFDDKGNLLYYFGRKGKGFGDFQLPTGLFIDKKDHVYVADSFNRRVQEFQYTAAGGAPGGKPQ